MKKVVINDCYGGFSLSHEGVMRYAEITGVTLYPKDDRFGLITYSTVPWEDRTPQIDWHAASMEERKAWNEVYQRETFYERDLPRDDPALIQVVEELGKAASGDCAALKVVEVPDEAEWEIEEYDGIEWVAEKHRTWS